VNIICNNFLADVQAGTPDRPSLLTPDGRTFHCIVDRWWNLFSTMKLRLYMVDLPEVRKDSPPEVVESAARATKCLSLLLIGDYFERDPQPNPFSLRGRSIIISPLRPNDDGKAAVRAYVQVARNSMLMGHLTSSIRQFNFLNVNAYMTYLGDCGWDLAKAKEIISSCEPMDASFVPRK